MFLLERKKDASSNDDCLIYGEISQINFKGRQKAMSVVANIWLQGNEDNKSIAFYLLELIVQRSTSTNK